MPPSSLIFTIMFHPVGFINVGSVTWPVITGSRCNNDLRVKFCNCKVKVRSCARALCSSSFVFFAAAKTQGSFARNNINFAETNLIQSSCCCFCCCLVCLFVVVVFLISLSLFFSLFLQLKKKNANLRCNAYNSLLRVLLQLQNLSLQLKTKACLAAAKLILSLQLKKNAVLSLQSLYYRCN